MSEPYFCTKCGRNHKSGKIYDEHVEFQEKKADNSQEINRTPELETITVEIKGVSLEVKDMDIKPKPSYVAFDEIHEIDDKILDEPLIPTSEDRSWMVQDALHIPEKKRFSGVEIGKKIEVTEEKISIPVNKTRKGKIFPIFYLVSGKDKWKKIWIDWIKFTTENQTKNDVIEHYKKHLNEKNVNRYSSDNLFAMLLYKEGIPIENMKVNYKKCSKRFLRKFNSEKNGK